MIANGMNLLLIIIGFGLVIVIHELGHFVAAKWAGIRVHAFAVGFGNAVCSYRKGMGFRMGSTEPEYVRQLQAAGQPADRGDLPGVSATEYRLNWIPFGGYVKMLGQEDMDPSARVNAPDSYNAQSVSKRLVVISAGVVMNVILAAILFVIVYGAGMRTPPAIVGSVLSGGPAASAGVLPGDVIRTINGREVDQFTELAMIAAMTKPGGAVELTVMRTGESSPIELSIEPQRDQATRLMQLGIGSSSSTILLQADADGLPIFREVADRLGYSGVEPGAELVSVNGTAIEPIDVTGYAQVKTAFALREAIRTSGGKPVRVEFKNPGGSTAQAAIVPTPAYQVAAVKLSETVTYDVRHLMGLAPAMGVESTQDRGRDAGLMAGDVFVLIGETAWPNIADGVKQIRAHAGSDIRMKVLRAGEVVDLTVPVDRDGTVGFIVKQAFDAPFIATQPAIEKIEGAGPAVFPGMRFVSVNGVPVSDFAELRAALRTQTLEAHANSEAVTIELGVRLSQSASGGGADETIEWALTNGDIEALHGLGWNASPHFVLFQQASYLRKAQNPIQAVTMGVGATRDMLVRTYITFLRLFDGTVRVEHLRGPIGIADVGVQFASQGIIYLLYFLALISANLAVINFLPIPFVDGGHAVFLIIEGIMRKPVPVAIQNVATLAGLIAIAGIFLLVTFNDISRLFG